LLNASQTPSAMQSLNGQHTLSTRKYGEVGIMKARLARRFLKTKPNCTYKRKRENTSRNTKYPREYNSLPKAKAKRRRSNHYEPFFPSIPLLIYSLPYSLSSYNCKVSYDNERLNPFVGSLAATHVITLPIYL